MRAYLDDSFSALGGTLLQCQSRESVIEVPERLGGQEITAIGRAAFFGLQELKEITLPATIRRVGKQAFGNCKKLSAVNFRGIPLSWAEYDALRATSVKVGTQSLASVFPDIPVIKQAAEALGRSAPCGFPPEIRELFCDNGSHAFSTLNLSRRLVFSKSQPGVAGPMMSEREAFMELIRRDDPGPVSDEAERKNDVSLRLRQEADIAPCLLLAFDSTPVKAEAGRVYITVRLDWDKNYGRFFWQSKRNVTLDGKKYYIYFRNYLSADPNGPDYIRNGMFIFSDKGPLSGEKEKNVINKFILSAIL